MIRKLGYLGLIPFIFLPLAMLAPHSISDNTLARIFTLYSVGIAAFMAGTLWGREIDRTAPKQYLLLASNAIALCVITLAFIAEVNIFGAILGLILVHLLNFFCERYKRHERYFLLRKRLTSVVVISHAAVLGILFWHTPILL